MKTLSTTKINYNSFDVTKFICSIMVVMIHVFPFGVQETPNIFSHINFTLQNGLCRIAVPMFFVFSGFFLYKKTPLDSFSIQPTKKYFIHILKMYLIWSLIYFPISVMEIINCPKGVVHGILLYIRNFVVNGSYIQLWYLNALLVAVAIISVLLYIKWSPKRILYTALVFYLFGLLGDGYFGIIEPLTKIPVIGQLLNLYFLIFGETRNGLFFAFFFVSMGMILSDMKASFSSKKSLILFGVSLFMLCVEAWVLRVFDIAKGYSLFVFTVPAALFGFLFLRTLDLKDSRIYKSLRELSTLIFYLHMIVNFGAENLMSLLPDNMKSTPLQFIMTLSGTIIISLGIMKLSEHKRFTWLKKVY